MIDGRALPLGLLSSRVIEAALRVHTRLGPGLLESAYRTCLLFELRRSALGVEGEVGLPVHYDGVRLEAGYRVDILVERQLIVEIKAVAKLLPIHDAQVISYLRLSGCPVGLLFNFHAYRLRDGMKRFVNGV